MLGGKKEKLKEVYKSEKRKIKRWKSEVIWAIEARTWHDVGSFRFFVEVARESLISSS